MANGVDDMATGTRTTVTVGGEPHDLSFHVVRENGGRDPVSMSPHPSPPGAAAPLRPSTFPPPWPYPYAAAWHAYCDNLIETGQAGREPEVLRRAREMALALELRPELILAGLHRWQNWTTVGTRPYYAAITAMVAYAPNPEIPDAPYPTSNYSAPPLPGEDDTISPAHFLRESERSSFAWRYGCVTYVRWWAPSSARKIDYRWCPRPGFRADPDRMRLTQPAYYTPTACHEKAVPFATPADFAWMWNVSRDGSRATTRHVYDFYSSVRNVLKTRAGQAAIEEAQSQGKFGSDAW